MSQQQQQLTQTRGDISVFMGPMFSGKSTSLLNAINKYEQEGLKVLVVNFAHDNRYSDEAMLVTHEKKTHKAKKCFQLEEIDNIYRDYDVIAIDEGQFFNDIADKCDEYANNGKIVVVAALDATFQRKGFNKILDLIPVAESVIKLKARCSGCNGAASFSSRKIQSQQIELIGGEDIYEPLCRRCFVSKQEDNESSDNSSDRLSENNCVKGNGTKESLNNSFSTEDLSVPESQPKQIKEQQQETMIQSS